MCSLLSKTIMDESDFSEQRPILYSNLSRRDVRSLIFHLLYAAESFEYNESLEAIVDNFNRGFNIDIAKNSDVFKISHAIIDKRNDLDVLYEPFLTNWRFDRISVATKLVLRLAVWELYNTETDARIVINEAVELAKCFDEEDAYRFINGILDRVAKTVSGETISGETVSGEEEKDKEVKKNNSHKKAVS